MQDPNPTQTLVPDLRGTPEPSLVEAAGNLENPPSITADVVNVLYSWWWCFLLAIASGVVWWIFFRRRKSPKSFHCRWLFSYLPLCVGLGILWYQHNSKDWIVAFATVLSIWLAAGAIDLGLVHENALRQVQSLIRSVFGLANYIEEASLMYKQPGIERVVTSLRHWVARGDPAKWIERGVRKSEAEQLVFVGTIEWGEYYPGVLWRFVTLRDIFRSGKCAVKEMQIHHVEPGVPIFVVSKKKEQTHTDRGSLLVGNPMETGGTNLYGLNLNNDHPRQVDHYNFIYDTLICPCERLVDQWPNILTECTGMEKPYLHKDGLQRIFEIEPFEENGLAYSRVTIVNHKDAAANKLALIEKKAEEIALQLDEMIQHYVYLEEEREFLPKKIEIVEWTKRFLAALCEEGIIEAVVVAEGEADGRIAMRLRRNSDVPPTCRDFFRDVAASQETGGAASEAVTADPTF